MKVAVIGANGQLGADVCEVFKKNGDLVVELNHDRMDICDYELSKKILETEKPDLVVNTASFLNVDKCEIELVKAYEVNAGGARNLAMLSAALDFKLYHISTDYVFDGKKNQPYVETDCVSPLNVYGNSKAAGDFFVTSMAPKGLVVRVSGIYGKHPCRAKNGVNFVNMMLKFGAEKPEVRVVNHEFISPTSTLEVARQLLAISRTDIRGICHASAEGSCSWYEFAKEIFRLEGIQTPLNIALPGEFPVKTPRPFYSVMENEVLKKNKINTMKHWKEGLAEYLGKN